MVTIREIESALLESAGCDLNQAMLLCVIADDSLSASEIANQIGMLPAQNSKLLSAVEEKGWIIRQLGQDDKRKIYFSLTTNGKKQLEKIKSLNLDIPKLLAPLLDSAEN